MTRGTKISLAMAGICLLAALLVSCGGSTSLSNLGPRELFDEGKAKYDDGKYLRATEYFQAIIYDYPGESLVDTAQYYLGLSYYGNQDYVLAQVEFNRLVSYYPSSVFVPHATFMRAVSFFEGTPKHFGLDQTDVRAAVKQFEDFLIDYPESELIPDVQAYLAQALTRLAKKDYSAAETYYRMNALTAAKKYYQKVIDEFTGSDYAAPSAFYLAEIDKKLKKYDDALRGFVNFQTVYPDHELAEKALELIPEMAFKSAEKLYDDGDLKAAKDRFQLFINDYPNDKRVKKANAFLDKIGEIPIDDEQVQATEGS